MRSGSARTTGRRSRRHDDREPCGAGEAPYRAALAAFGGRLDALAGRIATMKERRRETRCARPSSLLRRQRQDARRRGPAGAGRRISRSTLRWAPMPTSRASNRCCATASGRARPHAYWEQDFGGARGGGPCGHGVALRRRGGERGARPAREPRVPCEGVPDTVAIPLRPAAAAARDAAGPGLRGARMDFISILSIFVLACFVGYYVVWSVTPALHTPLMSVTNAISSVIIVGALIAAAAAGVPGAEMARPRRGGAGQRQHLRRLRGDRADARHVQEEGAQRVMRRPACDGAQHAGAPAWVMLAYLDLGHLLHPRAARAVEPGELAARQPRRHHRHGDRAGDHAHPLHADRGTRNSRSSGTSRRLGQSDADRRRDRDRRGRSASSRRGGSR